MKTKLMAHLVAYYPDRSCSLKAALGLAEGGASYLEVQFPFSDPSADGPSIQEACTSALDAGFTTKGGFDLVREICSAVETQVFIMSYASIVIAKGVGEFLDAAKSAGAAGIIIPDLAPGMDDGLFEQARSRRLHAVPVITPFLKGKRVEEILAERPKLVYVAIRRGITGKSTSIDEKVIGFLDRLSSRDVRVLAGFGVRTREQVALLSPHVHAVIAGSYFVDIIRKTWAEDPEAVGLRVKRGVEELIS